MKVRVKDIKYGKRPSIAEGEWQAFFTIGNQTFYLEGSDRGEEGADFYIQMLKQAFENLKPAALRHPK